MVYVLNLQKQPLMPCNEAKARKLLKQGKAKITKYEPFTIQLLFECENQVQGVNLGVDAGSKHIGISATTENKELYSAVVELRNDIVEKISLRREARKSRRNKLRYRKPRFDNRISSRNYAPSIEQKINSHIQEIKRICFVIPVSKIIVEAAQFDIQKINNPEISGEEYQQGNQLGFWNVREYVLWRDNHKCQHCKGKSKDNRLNVHHIESRKTGGNAPNNLICLCKTCHENYHKGKIKLNVQRGRSFRHAHFMGVMRKELLKRLREIYPNVIETYGYITKSVRIQNELPKEHYIDAFCISGNTNAKPLQYYWFVKCVRRQNRKATKDNFIKGGKKKNNQSPREVFGFRLFDTVEYQGKRYFVFGRRKTGYFNVRSLDGYKVNNDSISYKQLKRIRHNTTVLTERKMRGNEKIIQTVG